MPLGRLGLSSQRSHLTFELTQQVPEPDHVHFGALEAPHRLLLTHPVFPDPGGVLDDLPVFGGRGVQHRVDLTLRDDDVLLSSDTGVGQQLLDVEEPASHPVDLVLAGSVPVDPAGERDLGKVEGKQAGSVVDHQGHLGPPQGGAKRGSGEDDVLHLLGAQRPRRLGPHHPGDRVDDVRLAGSVGTHHDRHPGPELETGAIGERLEAGEFEGLQVHVLPSALGITWTSFVRSG